MGNTLEVCLTADIEFVINGALSAPDHHRPSGAESVFRVVDGREQGLAALLAPLAEFGLPATMFVETLQRIHFGEDPMRRVVERILATPRTDLQLHVHPCWLNFRSAAWATQVKHKKINDLMAGRGVGALPILEEAVSNFQELVGRKPLALRTGSLSVDMDVYASQARLGVPLASSVGVALQCPAEPELHLFSGLARRHGVVEVPVTTFKNWRGRQKLLTLGGNSFHQIQSVLELCRRQGSGPVVILTHASEMADSPGLVTPPRFRSLPNNQRRWRNLCRYLATNQDRYVVRSFTQAWANWHSAPEQTYDPVRTGFRGAVTEVLRRVALAH